MKTGEKWKHEKIKIRKNEIKKWKYEKSWKN